MTDRAWSQMRHVRQRRSVSGDAERGSITLWVAVLGVALFAMVGLVADGGTALAARSRAASDAFAAARAGAEALSPSSLASGGRPVVDDTGAQAAADAVLAADRASGTVTVTGATVAVTVKTTTPTMLLGLVGISSLTVSASASAQAVPGR